MPSDIPNCFYRVSIKGLILDETRTKFLVTLEKNGLWELPGGGLDWGESVENCLKRELHEEMGLTVTSVNPSPSYYLIGRCVMSHCKVGCVRLKKVDMFSLHLHSVQDLSKYLFYILFRR